MGLILGACQKHEEPAERAQGDDVPAVLAAVRKAYGGTAMLGGIRGYRAEAVISEARNRRTGEVVLWYRRPDRLRLEYRYPEGGHLQILSGDRSWLGAEDRTLAPGDSTFLTSMWWEARCRGLPWSLLADEERVEIAAPDPRGRRVLRVALGDGRLLDHHLDAEHRIVRLTFRESTGKVLYEMDLGEFRWIRGFLVPFKETVSDRGTRAIEIRFRNVDLDPPFPDSLFEPRR